MEYIITAIIAFWLGAKISTIWNRIVFRDILNDLGVTHKQLVKLAQSKGVDFTKFDDEEAAAETKPEEIAIKVEQHQGQLYAFRIENDEFLGQGKNREELIESLAKKFKNVQFTVPQDQGAELLKNEA